MNVGRAGGGGLDGYLLCEVVELLFCRWQPMPVFERLIPCGGGHSRRGFCGHWPGSAHQLTIHAAHPLSAFLNPFSNHKGMAVRLEPVNSCVMFLSRLGFSVLFTCCFCTYFLKAAEAFAHHSPLFSTPYPCSNFFCIPQPNRFTCLARKGVVRCGQRLTTRSDVPIEKKKAKQRVGANRKTSSSQPPETNFKGTLLLLQ